MIAAFKVPERKEHIDREAFKAEIRRLSTHYLNEWDTLGVLAAADRIPAADVRPVVRGAWRRIGKTGRIFVCSACDKTFPYKTRCCPNCGADMREES